MLDEPLRGCFPDPSYFSLSGMEQARRKVRGLEAPAPIHYVMGHLLTQVGSGSAAGTMPTSPWVQGADGSINYRVLLEAVLYYAVLSGAPPATEVRATGLAIANMRTPRVESGTLLARARTINTGPTFTMADAVVEDAQGRGVAHGTATYVIRAIDPPPPPHAGTDTAYEPPAYSTPHPWQRPLSWSPDDLGFERLSGLEVCRAVMAGALPEVPLLELLGIRPVEVTEGSGVFVMRATEQLCDVARHVAPGVIVTLAWSACSLPMITLSSPGERLAVLDQTVAFLAPVPPDGRELVARGRLTHRRGEVVLSSAEIIDGAGNVVAAGHQTSLLMPARPRKPSLHEAERVLATVLFTDIVASTETADQLGDVRWREVLREHDALVRSQLQLFKGKEIKTTGDGFLAIFDSPGRAVQAARATRDGVRRLGLEIRAGLHTGECEYTGSDVVGIAVHIAARIQASAEAGEVLVSGTVRDLVAGSGLHFADRGRRPLKGVEGEWPIFAVEN